MGTPVPIHSSLKLQRPVDREGRENNLVPKAGEGTPHQLEDLLFQQDKRPRTRQKQLGQEGPHEYEADVDDFPGEVSHVVPCREAVWEVGTAPFLTMACSGLGEMEVDHPRSLASILHGQVRRQGTGVSLDSPSEERLWSARDRYPSDHLEDFTWRYKVHRISGAEGSGGPKMRETFTSVEPGLQEATSGERGLVGAEGSVLRRGAHQASTSCREEPPGVTEAVT